jgi:hypothetical protein
MNFILNQSEYLKVMKKILIILSLLISLSVAAQKKKIQTNIPANSNKVIPLSADNWEFQNGKVAFEQQDSRPVMKISPNGAKAVLKNTSFSSGTIEFDFIPVDARFFSVYFRWQDAKENECFYFRTHRLRDSTAMEAVQYAPHISGVNLWDLLGHFQGNAYFWKEGWNHVKLVISGMQFKAYVNDMSRPVVEVPRLEGNVSEGTIAFEGESVISNLVIKMNDTGNLSPLAGVDLTDHDPRYLRYWQVGKPFETPPSVDFGSDFIPKPEAIWEPVVSERMGLINLTRKFGGSVNNKRRLVWLKVDINSKIVQKKKISLGFSDEVWVLLNGRYLYVDKNSFGPPIMKEPFGRLSLENTSFVIPFKEGKNEIMIGVANDFYGWGIVARMEDMEGISIIK